MASENPGNLSNEELALPNNISSPVLGPGKPRAPQNTPAGRSFDDNLPPLDDCDKPNNTSSQVNSNAVAAALDQLKLNQEDGPVSDPAATFGLTSLGELSPEVEALIQQFETTTSKLETDYQTERVRLELKYHQLRSSDRERRAQIINGATTSGTATTTATATATATNQGVPEFWSRCLQNHEQLATLLGEKDEDALAYLTDIQIARPDAFNSGFTLEFHFNENPFFENKVLTKTYNMESMILRLAEEPELLQSFNSPVVWKKDMNLSEKTATKRIRRKGKKGKQNSKTVVKTVQTKTFFSIFDKLPSMQDAKTEKDFENIGQAVEMDFEIALLIMNQIIPNAIMWYTGEAGDSDFDPEVMFGESDDEDDEEDGDGNDDQDDDANFQNPFANGMKGGLPSDQPKDAQEDCKTQ